MMDGTVKDIDSDETIFDVEGMANIACEVPDKIVKSKRGNVHAKQPPYTIYTRRSKLQKEKQV